MTGLRDFFLWFFVVGSVFEIFIGAYMIFEGVVPWLMCIGVGVALGMAVSIAVAVYLQLLIDKCERDTFIYNKKEGQSGNKS